jgi:hypothetical protein
VSEHVWAVGRRRVAYSSIVDPVSGDGLSSKTSAIVFQHATGEAPRAVNELMGDPRNVAHAKKVSQEKHHKDKHASKPGSVPSQRAKKIQTENKAAPVAESTAPKAEAAKPTQPVEPTQLEKSLVVLSKLKELEFHSRANIEKLAELSLTIEEELKQKPFAEAIGDVYAAQNAFQSKILELIGAYESECTRLSGSA